MGVSTALTLHCRGPGATGLAYRTHTRLKHIMNCRVIRVRAGPIRSMELELIAQTS